MNLLRSGRPVRSVFDLLGRKEDDMTFALGWVLSRSDVFANAFARTVTGHDVALADAFVRLQTIGETDRDGRTDVEIEGANFLIVVEAKRGPEVPSLEQLKKYVPRFAAAPRKRPLLVSLTNAADENARAILPPDIDGIALKHLSWRSVWTLTERARATEASLHAKAVLNEFRNYLSEILGMEAKRSNMVLVVSLSDSGAWGLGFKEVAEQRMYFDPVDRHRNGPPNYIAFRYDGKLQSIHHVERVSTFKNPREVIPNANFADVKLHYLFHLGPPIKPPHEVKNGPKIQRSNRVKCMIDTLLTSATITDALAETKRRLRGEPDAGATDEESDES